MLELTVAEISERLGEEVKVVKEPRGLKHGDVVSHFGEERFVVNLGDRWYGLDCSGEDRTNGGDKTERILQNSCKYVFKSHGFKIIRK